MTRLGLGETLNTAKSVLGSGFKPTDVTGLTTWYDALDGNTFTFGTGAKISQWRDKSASACHLSQATSANQPQRLTNQINGRPGIVFDSVANTNMVSPTTVQMASASTGEYTIFCVINPTTALGGSMAVYSNDNGVTRVASIRQISPNRAQLFAWDNTDVSGTDSSGNTFNLSEPYLVTALRAPTTLDILINNSGAGSTAIASGKLGATNNRVGEDFGAPFAGVLGEVLAYNKVVSGSEQTAIQNYLKLKWGTP